MPRHKRILNPYSVYHVMMRGNEKKNIFLDDGDRQRLLDTLRLKKAENGFDIYAYCFMSNHIHLLIDVKEEPVARVMKCINVSYARYFNKKYGRVGHLFQDRFKSENVDTEEYLLTVIHYIHNNPVKAGIVKNIADYKWSSYREYTDSEVTESIANTDFVLSMLSNDKNRSIEVFAVEALNYSKDSCMDDDLCKDKNLCMDNKLSMDKDSCMEKDSCMDIEEETTLSDLSEVRSFSEEYLAYKGYLLSDVLAIKRHIKGTIKHELIKVLKEKSGLSSRELGDFLGISKTTVNKL